MTISWLADKIEQWRLLALDVESLEHITEHFIGEFENLMLL